jgi:ThiF family
MSAQLIARSPDLSRLREEGYELDIREDHIVVKNVPYVTAKQDVSHGMLAISLTTSGERTGPPVDHTVWWQGAMPCHRDGTPITRIDAGGGQQLAPGLTVDRRFSSKPMPAGRYGDFYEQLTSYIAIVAHEAQAIDPAATARTFAPVEAQEDKSVFRYNDSAASRAGIKLANSKLELPRVAIVGLGGTGSYLLDLLAKTPAGEIHLFDGDHLLNHNAFRAPGAIGIDELRGRPLKVVYFQQLYDRLHRHVIAHEHALGEHNADELDDMSFVFICMDSGPAKRAVVEHLENRGISFIDVGMGLDELEGSIGGILRVTLSTPDMRGHVWEKRRIAFDDPDDEANEYARNIQVADLNALNACMAMIRYKRYLGFYRDLEHEHNSLYTIDGNHLLNEDQL